MNREHDKIRNYIGCIHSAADYIIEIIIKVTLSPLIQYVNKNDSLEMYVSKNDR